MDKPYVETLVDNLIQANAIHGGASGTLGVAEVEIASFRDAMLDDADAQPTPWVCWLERARGVELLSERGAPDVVTERAFTAFVRGARSMVRKQEPVAAFESKWPSDGAAYADCVKYTETGDFYFKRPVLTEKVL